MPERPPHRRDGPNVLEWISSGEGKDPPHARIRPIAVCLGLSMTTGFAVAAQAKYTVIPLQGAGGQGFNETVAINASGESVGYAEIRKWGLLRGAVVVIGDGDGAR